MKNCRKLRLFGCALLALPFVFSACDNGDDQTYETPQVGVALKSQTNNWRTALGYYAQNRLDEKGVSYMLTSAKDAAQQAKQLQMMADAGCRVIILISEEIGEDPVRKVIAQGVPVILGETELAVDYTTLVQIDNGSLGTTGAIYMAGKGLQQIGVIAVTQDPTSSNARVNAFKQQMVQSDAAAVMRETTIPTYTRAAGYNGMLALLGDYPDLDAVFAQDDEIALGVLDAVRELNNTSVQMIVGCGGSQTFLDLVRHTPDITLATVLYSPGAIMNKCVDVAADLLKGIAPSSKKISLPTTTVDRSNAAGYIDPSSPY